MLYSPANWESVTKYMHKKGTGLNSDTLGELERRLEEDYDGMKAEGLI